MGHSANTAVSAEYLNAFVEPAIHVLQTMAGLTAHVGPLRKQTVIPEADAVTVIIGIRGTLTGTVLFRFNKHLAVLIVKNITGTECTLNVINEDVQDALGELANVIAGNATGNLDKLGVHAMTTPPVIAIGSEVRLLFPNMDELIVIPLATQIGEIEMNVAFALQSSRETEDE